MTGYTNKEAAQLFIENSIGYIDDKDWTSFFQSFWEDYPVHMNHEIATEVMKFLKAAYIEWSESERIDVLMQGINVVLNDCYSSGESIKIYDLYSYDEPQWSDGPSAWLGYTAEEFYDIIIANKDKLRSGYLNGNDIVVK